MPNLSTEPRATKGLEKNDPPLKLKNPLDKSQVGESGSPSHAFIQASSIAPNLSIRFLPYLITSWSIFFICSKDNFRDRGLQLISHREFENKCWRIVGEERVCMLCNNILPKLDGKSVAPHFIIYFRTIVCLPLSWIVCSELQTLKSWSLRSYFKVRH